MTSAAAPQIHHDQENAMPEQHAIDPGIDRIVREIAAVDDHAHPVPLEWEVPPNPDHPISPYDHPLPLRMRQTNPEYLDAWRALWGYEHDDFDDEHLRGLLENKQRIQSEQGEGYGAWVLDQVNIETMLAVDNLPQPAFPAPRFRWITFADWLMWPVGATDQEGFTFQYRPLIEAAFEEAGIEGLPTTLAEYVQRVLEPELATRKNNGAVAVKFHTPYYRPINFAEVPEAQAAELYRRAKESGITNEEHRHLEDYLFAVIARRAGELDLPVQMHTGQGPRRHFQNQGSNPLLMEPAVVAAPDTKFLMLHAGWPFDQQAVASLSHDNVFLDISCATVHLYGRNLASIIRDALEWFPEKILYGTDAYSDIALAFLSNTDPRSNFLQGWEEKAWLLDRTAREATAMALTDMMRDRVIGSDDVERLARMVLRDNATQLYRL
ncbi:amidohydrolase family protein [Streptomyces sp. NPDC094149]|uniref:amidohydrolase family protein n=1 Tax=Streptomyces sp. NPDC094149 TaxID=3155079 RepID=UPI00332D4485